ncbi:PQQ-binding-like beta-propeller repeat protein [Anaeromyxobacter sp. PSR-1]|uniref:outer membrane protein assembly factor BamB family protein n=1 Tax=Anaeromyxobacter sp. PSR-1 TaxID=1300915 RepID=UPI0005E2B01B|nr:PQQ-binding-like beta-propeller repeat protein [Anaeromyxobacter sp. PSR-1]GAO05536.1 outer membrane protein assembly factor BamB [Anaeromyxobacter sp. PSR-1]
MDRMLALAAVLAVGCSGVKEDRQGCARSADCPAGEYCASTPDGAVCWPDAQPPAVSGVAVTCGPPCLRDGTLRVEATVADDHEVGEVAVALDLDPSRAVPMARAGGRWVAQVPLEGYPFPAFERAVVATVTARDGARNASIPVDVPAQTVTRLRWAQAAEIGATVALSPPAVDDVGTVVLGGSNGKVYRFDASGLPVGEPVQLPGGAAGTPAAAANAAWIGTQAGNLYAVDDSGGLSLADCSPGEPLAGPPVLIGAWAVIGSQAGVIVVADTSGFCNQTSVLGPVTSPLAVTGAGYVMAVSSGSVLKFALPTSGVLRSEWTGVGSPLPPRVGDAVAQPFASDAGGSIWTVAQNGSLNRTDADATTTTVATVPVGSSGPIVLADGSVVIGSGAGLLQRFSTAGAPPWTESEALNGVPAIPLALAGERPALLVPTSTGRLYAVDADDGKIAWSVKLSATGQALQPANVHGAPGAATSTAYVAGADGKLYAVIVDGQLDRAAPWPKAFHDPRNTGNAGALP